MLGLNLETNDSHWPPLFQGILDKQAPRKLTILDFNKARNDGWHLHQLDHAVTESLMRY